MIDSVDSDAMYRENIEFGYWWATSFDMVYVLFSSLGNPIVIDVSIVIVIDIISYRVYNQYNFHFFMVKLI